MKKPLLGVAALTVAAAAAAHVWLVMQGVHFKGGDSVDFGMPPPRYAVQWDGLGMATGVYRPGTQYFRNRELADEEDADVRDKKTTAWYRRIEKDEAAGRWAAALAQWRAMARAGLGEPGFVRERLRILKVLVSHPHEAGAKAFLAGTSPLKSRASLPAEVGRRLRPYVEWRRALDEGDPRRSAGRFEALAKQTGDSDLAEAALIMIPRRLLGAGNPHPNPDDERRALAALDALRRRFPNSRFAADAEGWRGRIAFLHGRTDEAARDYQRQLALAKSGHDRLSALDSLLILAQNNGRAAVAAAYLRRLSLGPDMDAKFFAEKKLDSLLVQFTTDDAHRFWDRIRQNRVLLRAYLDYRLDFTQATPDLLVLAGRAPWIGSDAHAQARLAEAALRLGRLAEAFRHAARCQALAPDSDDAALALYVSGSVRQRQGNFAAARRDFQRILDRYHSAYVAGGARENLALIAEKTGRLGDALDQYYALGYVYDVAYMLDMRMSPAQIAAYLRARPDSPDRDRIRFSLGLRLLREKRWQSAIDVLAAMPAKTRRRILDARPWYGNDSLYEDQGGLDDPLETARELAALDRKARRARGRTAKAAALYAMANYYYHRRDLLLYNPALWQGARAYVIGFSWNASASSPADDAALDRHHYETECLAQTLGYCRRALALRPSRDLAAQIAYRGATAAARLSDFNPYWRWKDSRVGLMAEAQSLMTRATISSDPSLAKAARKYAHVYGDERRDASVQWKMPSRRYGVEEP